MATIRFQIQVGGVATNVTSVVLADNATTPTYGVRRTDTLAVVVPAGTPMTNTAPGSYEHTFADTGGVEYEAWVAVSYLGETHHRQIIFTATDVPASATLELSPHDEWLVGDVGLFLDCFGEAVTVYPPSAASRSVTGIVNRGQAESSQDRRVASPRITVQLPNDSTTGISGAEWTNRFEIGVPRHRGGSAVRMRTLRAVYQDAAFITWEVG